MGGLSRARYVSGVIPMGAHFHRWRLGIRQFSFGHIARVLRRAGLDASGRPSAFPACSCPLELSRLGKPVDPGTTLQVPPG